MPENCKLGPGLCRNYENEKVVSREAGLLRTNATGQHAWVETDKKRYIPVKGTFTYICIRNTYTYPTIFNYLYSR